MPALDWQLLPNEIQELVIQHLIGAHLLLLWSEGQNETGEIKYLSIREWYRRHKKEQEALLPEAREGKMHPTCAARMVCKTFSEKLKLVVQSEVRVNSELCIKKKRFKSERLALTGIVSLLTYVSTGLSDGYLTTTQCERCKMHLITAWTARVADAVMKKNDPLAKFAYAALKKKVELTLGDFRPGTGSFRMPELRKKLAEIFKVLAVPVDDMAKRAMLGATQRQRRDIDHLVTVAGLFP